MTFEEWLGNQIDERNEIYVEIGQECYDNGYEQGKSDAIKFALNQIPCEKNCKCCLRNGISTCFVPQKDGRFYIQEMVDALVEQL